MAAANSHLVLPITLDSKTPSEHPLAIATLQALLGTVGVINIDNKRYRVAAFPSLASAEAGIRKPDDEWKGHAAFDFQREDQLAWVSVTSEADPTRPAALLGETWLDQDFLQQVKSRIEEPANAQRRDSFVTSSSSAVDELLTQLVFFDLYEDISLDLRGLPYTENVDVSDRGYVGAAFGVDPVACAMEGSPSDLNNAVVEGNIDYIGQVEADIEKEAVKRLASRWDDFEEALGVVGVDEGKAEEMVRETVSLILQQRGSIDLTATGSCAVSAVFRDGKDAIFISFDGITSSAYNAVLDEHYFAMLDVLQVDLRAWVDHLAARAEAPQPNWDIDLKAHIDALLPQARYSDETGIHWEDTKSLRADLISSFFGHHEDALPGGAHEETCSYLFDIALEVLKAQAIELEDAWIASSLTAEDQQRLNDAPVMSKSAQWQEMLEQIPMLKKNPNYESALVNLPIGDGISHEWRHPPHARADRPVPLVTPKVLLSVLENCSYDGTLVIAFEADLDDLSQIGLGVSDRKSKGPGHGKTIQVDGAYFHIHNYGNGAGDGEPLSGKWNFTTDDLVEGRVRLDNDTGDRYGIQSVFGQFLASGTGLIIEDMANKPAEPVLASDSGLQPA